MNPFQNHQQFSSLFESLEDRVLFDGVPDATFILPQTDVEQPVPAQAQDVQQADSGPRELVLIDAGVENSQELLAGILESKPNATLEIRVIDGDSDGVAQISAILAESDATYDAIHIISHGEEGEVNLGNTSLNSANLGSYADQLAGWSDALTGEADLLFYGCELAGNAEGQMFIESISVITGADVAASDDLTGSAELGGDWDLEVSVGAVEATILSAENWDGTLQIDVDSDGLDGADDLDDDNDGILDVDEGFVPATIVAIDTSALNSPGFATNTPLQNGNTATLNGLFNGLIDFEATIISDGAGPAPGFTTGANGGIQIDTVNAVGDFIFVQPQNTGDFPDDAGVYLSLIHI